MNILHKLYPEIQKIANYTSITDVEAIQLLYQNLCKFLDIKAATPVVNSFKLIKEETVEEQQNRLFYNVLIAEYFKKGEIINTAKFSGAWMNDNARRSIIEYKLKSINH